MLSQAYTLSLIFLSGFACYSSLNHFTMGRGQTRNRVHVLFAVVCLLMMLFVFFRFMELRATTVADSLRAMRLGLAVYILFNGLLLWFLAEYTAVRPLPILIGFTLLFAGLFALNLTQPYGLLRAEIHGVERLTLPWGEQISRPLGTSSMWGPVAIAITYLSLGFSFFALSH